MKKQLSNKRGAVTALLSLFVCAVLGLGACMNPLHPPVELDTGGNIDGNADGTTGVRVSIVTGEARTLLPSTPFSKYVLSFSTEDGGVTVPGDVTLTGVNTDIIPLAPATWTITVTAYIEVEEDVFVEAAEGEAEITLASGELKGVPIRVSAKLGGSEDGYFSYNITYPADVTGGALYVYDSDGATVINKNLLSELSVDDRPLPAGYYRLQVRLQTSYNSMAVRTEIIHIYPGMETRGDYSFDADDFGVPITITGTVDLSGLEDVSRAEICLYRNADFTSEEGYFSENNPSDPWTWTFRTLPFNLATDYYIELKVYLAGNVTLTKRIPAPISVYDQDISAPALGPFTVNRFDLGGTVDFSVLTDLGITPTYASVAVHRDDETPGQLGSTGINLSAPTPTWSLGLLTEEASLPVRIMLHVEISGSYFHDEIQTTLSADQSDLDFTPGPVSAGAIINGVGNGGYYRYLFVPDAPGEYVFKVSCAGSQNTRLALHDASGDQIAYEYGYPDAVLSSVLTDEYPYYYIDLQLYSPYRDFQFQVNPVSQVDLAGTVDFSDLLAAFSGVTVSSAEIAIYADNSAHTPLGEPVAINPSDGSWSATVGVDGPSVPVVFVITANLSNDQINHQVNHTISGDDSSLDFDFEIPTGGETLTRTTINDYDYLLYVPATTGTYSLGVSTGANQYMQVILYDAQTGSQLGSTTGYDEIELVRNLEAGKVYRIRVYANTQFRTYQFQASELQPVTLSGTVDLSGLAPLTEAGINIIGTQIQVYNGTSSPSQLGYVTVENNGTWSLEIPASGAQTVRIVAAVNLNNGRTITAHRQETISGDTPNLTLVPAAVSPSGGQLLTRVSDYGTSCFLLVPATTGLFNLGASSANNTPSLTLYDASANTTLASGSASLYAELTAGTPYIVQVSNITSFTAYQFLLTPAASATVGGSVDYSNLPFSISSIISSATVNGYLNNTAHTQVLFGAAATSGAWSAPVPANAIGQTINLVLTINLNYGMRITSHIQTFLEASAANLDFAPAAVSAGTALNSKTSGDAYDWLLFVPETSDDFALQAASDIYTRLVVYNGLTGSSLTPDSTGIVTLSLSTGTPYIIRVYANGNRFYNYQFYAVPPITLGGNVDYSGLTSWSTASANVLIFAPAGNYTVLDTWSVSGASWSVTGALPSEVFIALVAQSSDGSGVLAAQTVDASEDDNSIGFSPDDSGKNVATGEWHDRSTAAGARGDWLLWIPESAGTYRLDTQTDGSMDTYMYLYDGLTGALIEYDDDDGDTFNDSRIQRSDFEAEHPYLIRVRDYINRAGTFRFKAESVSP
jgi:hypothetical protein